MVWAGSRDKGFYCCDFLFIFCLFHSPGNGAFCLSIFWVVLGIITVLGMVLVLPCVPSGMMTFSLLVMIIFINFNFLN